MSQAQPPHSTQPDGGQPGNGQQPPIWQGDQQPPNRPRRNRHVTRNLILGAVGLIVVIVIAAALVS